MISIIWNSIKMFRCVASVMLKKLFQRGDKSTVPGPPHPMNPTVTNADFTYFQSNKFKRQTKK